MINHNKFYKDLDEALLQEGPSGKELEKWHRLPASRGEWTCPKCFASEIPCKECQDVNLSHGISTSETAYPPYKAVYGSGDDEEESITPRRGYRSGQELGSGATNDVRDEEEVANPPPRRQRGALHLQKSPSLNKWPALYSDPLRKSPQLQRTPRLGKTYADEFDEFNRETRQ